MAASIHETVSGIIASFESGDIPEAIAYSMFPISDIPSAKWSLLNRTIMFLAGTQDARGFRQWKQAGRYVKKGARCFRILVPCFIKTENEENGEIENTFRGFMCRPVFRVEDSDGETLDYEQLELPDFPLIERAKEWGISIKAILGNYRYYGYYIPGRNEIALATPEESIFFHELAHAAHEKDQRDTEGWTGFFTGNSGGTICAGSLSDGRKTVPRYHRQLIPIYRTVR